MAASSVNGQGCGCSSGKVPLSESQLKRQLTENRAKMGEILPMQLGRPGPSPTHIRGILLPLGGSSSRNGDPSTSAHTVPCPEGNPECQRIVNWVSLCWHYTRTPCWKNPNWGDTDRTKKHYRYERREVWYFCPNCSTYVQCDQPQKRGCCSEVSDPQCGDKPPDNPPCPNPNPVRCEPVSSPT